MQLGSVCSKFAEAAMLVPALRYGFRSFDDPPKGIQLGSACALQCAGQVRVFHISSTVLRLPGLAAFLAAAKQVTRVEVVCTSMLEAVQADFMLGQCSAITALSLRGSYMPAVLPSTVTELEACFSGPAKDICSISQPDALIYHAALLPQLRRFTLGLSPVSRTAAALTVLQFPVQLPLLQSLDIYAIHLSAPSVDLKWVQQQPCSELILHIAADTPDVAKHAAIVKQLSHLTLSSISLDMDIPFTPELQALWSGVEVGCLALETTAVTLEPLQMLPRCSELRWDHCPDALCPAYASWHALTSRAARILVTLNGQLHVEGAGSSAPVLSVIDADHPIHASDAEHVESAHIPAAAAVHQRALSFQ